MVPKAPTIFSPIHIMYFQLSIITQLNSRPLGFTGVISSKCFSFHNLAPGMVLAQGHDRSAHPDVPKEEMIYQSLVLLGCSKPNWA